MLYSHGQPIAPCISTSEKLATNISIRVWRYQKWLFVSEIGISRSSFDMAVSHRQEVKKIRATYKLPPHALKLRSIKKDSIRLLFYLFRSKVISFLIMYFPFFESSKVWKLITKELHDTWGHDVLHSGQLMRSIKPVSRKGVKLRSNW